MKQLHLACAKNYECKHQKKFLTNRLYQQRCLYTLMMLEEVQVKEHLDNSIEKQKNVHSYGIGDWIIYASMEYQH